MVPERNYSFETPPAKIPASSIKKTLKTEIVIVGAGISGLAAAISAADKGAKVVMIEKTNSCHGYGGDNSFIGSRLQKKLGINIDANEVVLNLMKYAANRPDQRLLRMWAEDGGETADWLMDMTDAAGLETTISSYPPPAGYDNATEYYPQYLTCHHIHHEGLVAKCLMNNALEKGVVIHFKTRAKQLLRKGKGRVTGLVAQDAEGNYIKYQATKATILCTGDYGNNAEMMAKYCPQAAHFGTTLVTATGDGHQMAMWVGAMMEPAPHAPMIHSLAGPLGMCAFLQVNRKGERFENEDVLCECYHTAVERQPGQEAWQVFDAKYPEELPRMGIGLGKMTKLTDENLPFINNRSITANTIEELAEKMGVPVATFKATIARYNELARLGKDLDFGKRADRMTTIEKPPYYAGKGFSWFMCAMGGLMVNTKLQPVDKDWEVIPGLYLGGNIVGNRYGVKYPSMLPGLSNGMALHLGRVAGMNAATLEG
jgi:fumarate reductase flavoprotein subunit